MTNFTYNDIVRVNAAGNTLAARGRGWVVGVFEERPGSYFDKFPKGVIYTIEFEDGSSAEIHEDQLVTESTENVKALKRASS